MQSVMCVHAVIVLKSFKKSTQYQGPQHLYFLCWLNYSSPENKKEKNIYMYRVFLSLGSQFDLKLCRLKQGELRDRKPTY